MDTKVCRGVEPSTEGRSMVITRTGVNPPTRTVFSLRGVTSGLRMGVHNSSLTNLRRGLMERVFHVERAGSLALPPRPIPGLFSERLGGFAQRLHRYLPRATPVGQDEFLDFYTGRKRAQYAAAVESLGSKPVTRRDAYLSTFIKAEKINFDAKPDPAPRVIQPRSPRYNVEVGRFLKPLEHQVYHAVDKVWGGPTVMKGYNLEQQARHLRDMWDEFEDPVAVGLDASRFDQHVSEDALRWEHSIYEACFRGADRLALRRLLKWQIHNKGFGRIKGEGWVKYEVTGCRMSGDMNTALGNCLLMSAMVWAFIGCRVRCRLANNGDDCVVILNRKDLPAMEGLAKWFEELGFTMKVEAPVRRFEEIVFCQTQPVWVEDRWLMVRDPYVGLDKDITTVHPLQNEVAARKWLGAIGEGGLAVAGGVPIAQELYALLSRHGLASKIRESTWMSDSGFMRLAGKMQRGYMPISAATRYSFYLAFGILPDMQVAVEEQLKETVLSLSNPPRVNLDHIHRQLWK